MERVLPDKDIRDRIAEIAVGLAADCDRHDRKIEEIFAEPLKGARVLPFVGIITPTGEWVAGYSGYKGTDDFLKVLETAENAPYLQASDATRAKLAKLVTRAEEAAGKGDWRTVMRARKDAEKSHGRCPERGQLAEIVKRARAWAAGEFDAAIRLAQSGGDLDDARAKLMDVKKQLLGEPEADEANEGVKALQRLAAIAKIEAGGGDASSSREKAADEYEGTRWTALFETAAEESSEVEDSDD